MKPQPVAIPCSVPAARRLLLNLLLTSTTFSYINTGDSSSGFGHPREKAHFLPLIHPHPVIYDFVQASTDRFRTRCDTLYRSLWRR